jgi:hypothetical protein
MCSNSLTYLPVTPICAVNEPTVALRFVIGKVLCDSRNRITPILMGWTTRSFRTAKTRASMRCDWISKNVKSYALERFFGAIVAIALSCVREKDG